MLLMRRTDGSRTGSSSLKRLDGVGSNKQVVDLEEFTNFDNVSGEIISNCEKMQLGLSPGSTVLGLLWGSILFMISSIFVGKKFKKSSVVNEELGGGVFFSEFAKGFK